MQGNMINREASLPIALGCIVFILLSAVISNYPAIEVLAQRWLKFDENLGHALPMLALYGFFAVKGAKQLAFSKGIPLLSIVSLAVIVLATYVMKYYHVLVAQQLLIWLFIGTSYFVLFQPKSLHKSLFAFGLLIFVIPVWDQLIPFLAELTTFIVQIALELSGIVAYFDGRNIELPYGVITVADSCSGVRYLTIGLALSYISAFTLPINLTTRFGVIIVGLLLSVFANWLRVYIIVLVGYYSEMESELVADHELFGFVLFFIVISPIVFYKPRVTYEQGQDKLAMLASHWLSGLFSKVTQPVSVVTKLALLLVTAIITVVIA